MFVLQMYDFSAILQAKKAIFFAFVVFSSRCIFAIPYLYIRSPQKTMSSCQEN